MVIICMGFGKVLEHRREPTVKYLLFFLITNNLLKELTRNNNLLNLRGEKIMIETKIKEILEQKT